MTDLRWFAPNRFCTLVVPALRATGLSIDTEGDGPARVAVAMDGQCAVAGFEYARRHRCPLLLYLWDLPPWRLGTGRPDVVFEWHGRVRRMPRLVGGYPERSGYYSRIRFIARRATWVWAPSALTVADVGRRFGVAADRVAYCFDSDRFRAVEWAPSVPYRILAVSRLVPHKNHAALIRAAARITPKPLVHLIGQGPEAPALLALARDRDVPLRLDQDWQTDEAIAAAYREATVVVSPSRFEGFGLTPMEGVASGIPSVASDIPPHREHLGEAVTYFDLENDDSLVAAIRAAVERGPVDPGLMRSLTIEAAARRFAELLSPLLDRVGR
ncbi:MAG: glycosyltransferase [Gemmatimonadales bacterium]|nr:glycosyltransferase [Gemmatimonadales bacterium]